MTKKRKMRRGWVEWEGGGRGAMITFFFLSFVFFFQPECNQVYSAVIIEILLNRISNLSALHKIKPNFLNTNCALQ